MIVRKAGIQSSRDAHRLTCAWVFDIDHLQLKLIADASATCLPLSQLLDPAQTAITIWRHNHLPRFDNRQDVPRCNTVYAYRVFYLRQMAYIPDTADRAGHLGCVATVQPHSLREDWCDRSYADDESSQAVLFSHHLSVDQRPALCPTSLFRHQVRLHAFFKHIKVRRVGQRISQCRLHVSQHIFVHHLSDTKTPRRAHAQAHPCNDNAASTSYRRSLLALGRWSAHRGSKTFQLPASVSHSIVVCKPFDITTDTLRHQIIYQTAIWQRHLA